MRPVGRPLGTVYSGPQMCPFRLALETGNCSKAFYYCLIIFLLCFSPDCATIISSRKSKFHIFFITSVILYTNGVIENFSAYF